MHDLVSGKRGEAYKAISLHPPIPSQLWLDLKIWGQMEEVEPLKNA